MKKFIPAVATLAAALLLSTVFTVQAAKKEGTATTSEQTKPTATEGRRDGCVCCCIR